MDEIISLLEEGDLRSISRVPEVVKKVLKNPELIKILVQGLIDPLPGVRMRASDALEKISRTHPEHLKPYKTFILKRVLQNTQQEVRWHTAQILPRLDLSKRERGLAAKWLFEYLEDTSKIVQTNALQALVDLSWKDDQLFDDVRIAVERLAETGSPAVRNRAGKLLPRLVRD